MFDYAKNSSASLKIRDIPIHFANVLKFFVQPSQLYHFQVETYI